MTRPRILRYLRITISAVCLIACVLLVGLWVRSYQQLDDLGDWQKHPIVSAEGRVLVHGRYTASETSPFLLGGLRVIPVGAAVTVPYWSLVLVTATLAALPWIPSSSRFSLRTLLLATTLLALILGIVVYVL